MSDNKSPCGQCKWYDPIMGPRGKLNPFGWCSLKSIYPAREGVGQSFPPNVRRMDDPAKPAKPVVVHAERIEAHCTQFSKKV